MKKNSNASMFTNNTDIMLEANMMPFEERKSRREIGKLIGKLDSAMTLAEHIDLTPETHKQIAQL